MDFRSIQVSGKIENKWIWAEIIDRIRFFIWKVHTKMGLPIFLIDFLCILSNYIDNFSPNPFIFDFSRNPDRSEIHLFSIFQDFPISPVKAVKILLNPGIRAGIPCKTRVQLFHSPLYGPRL